MTTTVVLWIFAGGFVCCSERCIFGCAVTEFTAPRLSGNLQTTHTHTHTRSQNKHNPSITYSTCLSNCYSRPLPDSLRHQATSCQPKCTNTRSTNYYQQQVTVNWKPHGPPQPAHRGTYKIASPVHITFHCHSHLIWQLLHTASNSQPTTAQNTSARSAKGLHDHMANSPKFRLPLTSDMSRASLGRSTCARTYCNMPRSTDACKLAHTATTHCAHMHECIRLSSHVISLRRWSRLAVPIGVYGLRIRLWILRPIQLQVQFANFRVQ